MAIVGAGEATAQTAAELMAEGNALVRSGVYRTALLRYREAAAAGFDTPLLHFNVGVVHYKLGNFADAAAEFAAAAGEPALTALASYNRGLALRAAGDGAAATAAFTAAAESADARDLRRLAANAAQSRPAAEPEQARVTRRFEPDAAAADKRIGELFLTAAARLGQDDNVYRTPSSAYVDLANPLAPTVAPVVHSASFMPAELHAAYLLGNEAGDTEFMFRYDLDGAFYDAEFSNANEIDQRFSMGADIVLGEREKRRRTVDTEFFVSTHDETNYDPDNGLERDIDLISGVVEDISDRFSYKGSGVRGEFEQTLGRITWGFELRFERDEYGRTEAVANFDHDYFYTGVDVDYAFSDAMTLRLGLRGYRTLFDTRPARDLNGELLDTNPAQEYGHLGVQLGVTRQLGAAVELAADYLRLQRTDEFLGYYDYTQDVLRLGAAFRPTPRFDIELAAVARSYDYSHAFAFHVAAGGPRELEEVGLTLDAEFRVTRRLTLKAALDSLDVTSTDARAEYLRTQTMLGVEWRK
ncbi:MAG TPA: tetratricopeptide repeat protein [Gammaproteobacteria bacterium]|nr:tetratricopeptide repeat protein [Gammaproteobacteria bacterium]